MKDQPVIELVDLTKRFGAFTAVDRLNLEVRRGEILGFLGPNGAGKSTTMKMVAGLLRPSEGEVRIRDDGAVHVLTSRNKDALLRRLGFLIENPAFYPNVTPRQVLAYFAKLKGFPRDRVAERVEEVVNQVGMADWLDHQIRDFSKGMRQKVGVASALVHDPDVLVLDEPQTGLDPKARKEMRDLLSELKERGKTIFLSSHILFDVSEVADRVAIISHGQLVAVDTVDNLEARARHSVIRVETLDDHDDQAALNLCAKLEPKLRPLTGLEKEDVEFTIQFDRETRTLEVLFDGSREAQHAILKRLLEEGVRVTEFSVPKANLLEELYVKLVDQAELDSTNKRRQI
ncbi:MAG: ABC transporter ATP-binding protein [Promethearchaeota archaeon]